MNGRSSCGPASFRQTLWLGASPEHRASTGLEPFPDRANFASWTGTAPIDACSGEHTRHRLSRAGNRRLNHVLHIATVAQLRNDTDGRAYYRRKLAESKTPMEAMRCLPRRLSDVVYRQLVTDATVRTASGDQAGPGGHPGATLQSSAADLPPDIGTSDQSLPGPAPRDATRARRDRTGAVRSR
jgi:transposase